MIDLYANIFHNVDNATLLKEVRSEYLRMLAEIGTPDYTEPIVPRIKSFKIYYRKCPDCNKAFTCNIITRKLCGACRVYHRYKKQ